MTNRTSHSECLQYSPYLYDYLCNNRDDIPESALTHIAQCAKCAAEINLLETELKACDASTDNAGEAARLANLELQFAYIGKDVGCSEVKPFLVSMVSDSLGMKIPTPITVHIDSCSACSNDMQEIQKMALTEKQLFKVGRMLADFVLHVPVNADVKCERSQIAQLAMIAKRPESGIRTCYSLKDENDGRQGHVSEQVYQDWQIDVKVSHNQQESNDGCTTTADDNSDVKKRSLVSYSWRFAKPVAAAAAVLMVALILFNGPVAVAGLELVYKAIGQVKNVYLKTISVIDGNVAQEVWVSKDLNIKIGKNDDKSFIWDIGHKRLITREDSSSAVNTLKLDEDLLLRVKETMEVPWSLLPFNNMSDLLAAGAEWQVLTGTETGDVTFGIDVYEISWTETRLSGNVIAWKWRGYIDSKTSLPKRVERWSKHTGDDEYQLRTAIEVTYPDTEQVRIIMDEIQR